MSDNRLAFLSPITPNGRDAFYSSIPVSWSDPADCVVCLACARDTSTEPTTDTVTKPKPARIYPEDMLYTNKTQVVECDLGGSFTVEAGKFGSNTSQEDADQQAIDYGENICNGNYWNEEQTATCPSGQSGSSVTVPAHTFYSPISQDAANALALASAQSALVCVPSIPTFDLCGSQDWPTATNNFPYSNTGDNTTGWGPDIVESPGWTSSGGVIISGNNQNGWAGTDIIVGEFDLNLEVYFESGYDPDFIITFSDNSRQRGLLFRTSPVGSDTPTNLISYGCDISNSSEYYFPTDIISTDSTFPVATWAAVQLKRVGSVFTFVCNGVTTTYDCGSNMLGRIGFGAYGVLEKRLRNITIAAP